jgi:hypothetical protein
MVSRPGWYWPIARTFLGLACKPFSPVAHVLDFLHFLFGNESGSCSFQKEEFKKKNKGRKNIMQWSKNML